MWVLPGKSRSLRSREAIAPARAVLAVYAETARGAAAVLLVLAGVTKSVVVGERGFLVLSLVDVLTAPSATLLALVEIVAGLWLAHARRRHVTWAFAVVYALFAVVAFAAFARGERSCGCFAFLAIPPKVQSMVDLAVAIGLLLSGRGAGCSCRPSVLARQVLCWAVLGTGIAMLFARPDVSLSGLLGSRLYVRVESLVDDPFPLELVEPIWGDVDQLHRGRWLVVIGSPDCPRCHRWLHALAQDRPKRRWRLAFWATSLGGADSWPVPNGTEVMVQSSTSVAVVGRLPALVYLEDGRVVWVRHSLSYSSVHMQHGDKIQMVSEVQ